ncbi:MAG: TolC family protein [Bacteroidaceae bacterium]|nr:TolC family protein [Bacteroidaceae bacterium]
MKRNILYIVLLAVGVSSCHIYKPYKRPDVDTKGMYRDPVSVTDTLSVSDTTNMGNLPWEQVFTDPQLQHLIRQGLENNSDLKTAALRVSEAEARLMTSRLAFLPSLSLAPQGTVSSFDKSSAQWSYQLPVAASWEIDLFGRLLNSKRGAKAALLQSEAYKQAVQTQVISTVANYYYTLLMLDRQLSITEQTARNWEKNVQMMKDLKAAGNVNEAAVVQSEANYYAIVASLSDLRRQISESENALSVLLGQAPQMIVRGTIEEQQFPVEMNTGIPVQMLSNRPDVRSAEMVLAGAYYNTNIARSAFYPNLVISGSAGWTNSAGGIIMNPAKFFASAVASLTQPLFARGANVAQLKIAKAQQEEALIAFQQSILNAGSEVSNALVQYQAAEEKLVQRKEQIKSLEKSVEYTQDLLYLDSSHTYLEVLTAQQSLLSAQLSEVADNFQRMQSVINLYHALGGGR